MSKLKNVIKNLLRPFVSRFAASISYYDTIENLNSRILNLEVTSNKNLNNSQAFFKNQFNSEENLESLNPSRLGVNPYLALNNHYVDSRVAIFNSILPKFRVDSKAKFSRYGSVADGGYVILDDLNENDTLISAGLADDINFEIELARKMKKVVMLDPTSHDLFIPDKDKMTFFQAPLISQSSLLKGFSLKNLLDLFPSPDYILKIDIEGHEWAIFNEISPQLLSNFRQIIIEMHGIDFSWTESWDRKMLNAIQNLTFQHTVVSLHPNNTGRLTNFGKNRIPETVELLLLRNNSYSFLPGRDTQIDELLSDNDPNLEKIPSLEKLLSS